MVGYWSITILGVEATDVAAKVEMPDVKKLIEWGTVEAELVKGSKFHPVLEVTEKDRGL